MTSYKERIEAIQNILASGDLPEEKALAEALQKGGRGHFGPKTRAALAAAFKDYNFGDGSGLDLRTMAQENFEYLLKSLETKGEHGRGNHVHWFNNKPYGTGLIFEDEPNPSPRGTAAPVVIVNGQRRVLGDIDPNEQPARHGNDKATESLLNHLKNGQLDLAEQDIKNGADVNHTKNLGHGNYQPMINELAVSGNVEEVKFLLEHHASMTAVDGLDETLKEQLQDSIKMSLVSGSRKENYEQIIGLLEQAEKGQTSAKQQPQPWVNRGFSGDKTVVLVNEPAQQWTGDELTGSKWLEENKHHPNCMPDRDTPQIIFEGPKYTPKTPSTFFDKLPVDPSEPSTFEWPEGGTPGFRENAKERVATPTREEFIAELERGMHERRDKMREELLAKYKPVSEQERIQEELNVKAIDPAIVHGGCWGSRVPPQETKPEIQELPAPETGGCFGGLSKHDADRLNAMLEKYDFKKPESISGGDQVAAQNAASTVRDARQNTSNNGIC